MRRILPTLFLLCLLTACGGPAPTPEPTAIPATQTPLTPDLTVIVEPTFPVATPNLPRDEAGVPRVALEQAYVAWAAGTAIILDVRSAAAYEAGHIEGAVNIPLGEIETNAANLDLPKDQWIITYCT